METVFSTSFVGTSENFEPGFLIVSQALLLEGLLGMSNHHKGRKLIFKRLGWLV
jgi:hypothetical protein